MIIQVLKEEHADNIKKSKLDMIKKKKEKEKDVILISGKDMNKTIDKFFYNIAHNKKSAFVGYFYQG